MADLDASRPRTSAFLATSLDGYIAGPGGSLDWLRIVERPDEDYGYRAFFDSVDALVLGRSTYDAVLGMGTWPYTGKRCLVLTHRKAIPRHGEAFLDATPARALAHLTCDGVQHVYVDGGSVVRQFLDADLLDRLTVSILPVVLGGGIPLFTPGAVERRLALDDVRSWPSGLAQLRYRLP
jgi:dihydrofolate reductase